MGRKPVTLAWIENDARRRMTLRKRRKGLMKKVRELSTLCGVEACAVLYAPEEARPEVWPSEAEAEATLLRYKAMPEAEQRKKSLDRAGFMDKGTAKLEEQIRRLRAENWELELKAVLAEALEGKRSLMDVERVEDAVALDRIIGEKMNEVKMRVSAMKAAAAASNPSTNASTNPNPDPSKGMGLRFWNVTGATASTHGTNIVHNPNPNPSEVMEIRFLNVVGAMKESTDIVPNPNPNPSEGMEIRFWNVVGATAANHGTNIVHSPNPNPSKGRDIGFWNVVGATKESTALNPSTNVVPNPNPNPNPNPTPSGGTELGFWNGGHYRRGFGGSDELKIQGSSSWVDLSIFKDCPY